MTRKTNDSQDTKFFIANKTVKYAGFYISKQKNGRYVGSVFFPRNNPNKFSSDEKNTFEEAYDMCMEFLRNNFKGEFNVEKDSKREDTAELFEITKKMLEEK